MRSGEDDGSLSLTHKLWFHSALPRTLNNVGLIRPKDILNLRSVLCAYVQDLLVAVIDKLLRTSNMPNLLINCGQKSIESVFVCCLRSTKETTTVNDEQQKRERASFSAREWISRMSFRERKCFSRELHFVNNRNYEFFMNLRSHLVSRPIIFMFMRLLA